MRDAIARVAVEHNGLRIAVTVSGGLRMIHGKEESESFIQRADAALYAAMKRPGEIGLREDDGTLCRPAGGHRSSL